MHSQPHERVYLYTGIARQRMPFSQYLWPPQSWMPAILRLIIDIPILISCAHLSLPGTQEKHPLFPKLQLTSSTATIEKFVETHGSSQKNRISSCLYGDTPQELNTIDCSNNGTTFVIRKTSIHVTDPSIRNLFYNNSIRKGYWKSFTLRTKQYYHPLSVCDKYRYSAVIVAIEY